MLHCGWRLKGPFLIHLLCSPNIAPSCLSKRLPGSWVKPANSGHSGMGVTVPYSYFLFPMCPLLSFLLCPKAPEETRELRCLEERPVQNTMPFSARAFNVPMSKKWPPQPSWPGLQDLSCHICGPPPQGLLLLIPTCLPKCILVFYLQTSVSAIVIAFQVPTTNPPPSGRLS